MQTPLVSVVMPVYGVERYVGAAVQSILAQTLDRFELIVVDDCTLDSSIAVVQSFKDNRVRVVRHELNLGLAAARNTGIAHARGRYIALLDSDDISTPERLALQVDALEGEPELIGCGGWMRCMDAEGRLYGSVHRSETKPSHIVPTLLFRNAFFVSSMMFRRSAICDLRYRTDFRMAEDYEFMVQASQLGRLRNLSEVLLHYRVHASSMTSTKPQLMDECRRRIAVQQLQCLGIEPTPAELNAHMLAAIPNEQTTLQQLADIALWLQRLSPANRAARLCAQGPFDDVIAASWFEACTLASGQGPRVLARYLGAGLLGKPHITVRRRLNFVAKSLLGLRRSATDMPKLGGASHRKA
ncbi:MAG: glycosyltransferase family 2 protein [Rhizobacter sp.]